MLSEKVWLLTFDPSCPSVTVDSFWLSVSCFLWVFLVSPARAPTPASAEPAEDYRQPDCSAQVLAVKAMEEAISFTEALALSNTGWQSVFPRAWQRSSQHSPHPSSSVRYNRTNERSDFSPDRLS